MDTGGGTFMMRSTTRLNRHGTRIPSSFSFFQDPIFWKPFQIARLSDSSRKGKTNEVRSFDVQGNTQVVFVNDRYTCFTYLHAACPWMGHVKWSYLFSLNALIVNICLDVLSKWQREIVHNVSFLLLSSYFPLNIYCIRTLWYDQFARGFSWRPLIRQDKSEHFKQCGTSNL